DNEAEAKTTVVGSADLEAGTSGPKEAPQGAEVSYAASATNLGPDAAIGVVLADTIPPGSSFVSATGPYSESGGVVTWDVGQLPPGSVAEYSLSVRMDFPEDGETKVVNKVGVTSSTPDPEEKNNTAEAKTEIIGSADLEAGTSGPATAVQGTPITYSVSVANKGPDPAMRVVVSDTIPAGMSFLSATGEFSEAGGVIVWEVGTLDAGVSVLQSVSVSVDLAGEKDEKVVNIVGVTSATPDPKEKNNTAEAKTTITPPPGGNSPTLPPR
ncbi:DUF11 domain-containing protein, partial [Gemmatimonadota bacterium]